MSSHKKRPPSARPTASRPRPSSAIPQTGAGVHSLYVEMANLQMSKARQEKIRDALLEQVRRCEAEIARVDTRCEELQADIDARQSGQPRRLRRRGPESSSTQRGLSVDEWADSLTFKY